MDLPLSGTLRRIAEDDANWAPGRHAGLWQNLNIAAVAKGLHDGYVKGVGRLAGRAPNGPILKHEQMFDPAGGSGAHNLVYICRSVACPDLLVELLQSATHR